MFISCPCTHVSGQPRVWSGPSGTEQLQTKVSLCQQQARDLDFVLCRTGSQQSLWIKGMELGVVPRRQAETVAVTRGVRKRGTQRREFSGDDRASCLEVHIG